MKRRSGLLAASLLLSALIHGTALELPGWALPGPEEAAPEPLRATLMAPPRPALAAPPAPAAPAPPRPAARKAKPNPPAPPAAALPPKEEIQPAPEAAPAPVETPQTPEAAPEAPRPTGPVAEPAPPAPPLPAIGPNWPRRGRIVYDIFRGDKNFLVGRTEHSWEQDGRRYSMQAVVETIGLAALIRSFHYMQTSEGRVTAGGLAPERFRVEQTGKPGEGADFEWAAGGTEGEAVVRRAKKPERRAAVRAGDQDVLSIWHQLALMGEPPPHQRLTLVSSKAATAAELESLGVDVLDLPLGQLIGHHLRARAMDGSLSLDIWLAEKYGYLPVRILVKDRQGEIFDQRAREISLGEGEDSQGGVPEENKTNG